MSHDHHGHDHGAHDHGHGHGHGHGENGHGEDEGHEAHNHHHDLRKLGQRALLVALILNASFFVVEAAVGYVSGSLALLSDAAHMASDVVALSVAFFAATLRTWGPSGHATYGHGRVAVLGGLVNALLSFGAAAVIVREALERFQDPPQVPGLPVLATAAVGLAVNLASAWWLHRSGDHGVNMRGALLHMLGDALGSVAALVAGVVLLQGGPLIVDAVASVVVAVIVAGSAVPLLRDVVHILLERAPPGLTIDKVRPLLKQTAEVDDVTGFHAWCLDDGQTVASFVLSTREPDLRKLARVADALREQLEHALGIVHATIEWRPVEAARGCCDEERDHEPDRHQPAA